MHVNSRSCSQFRRNICKHFCRQCCFHKPTKKLGETLASALASAPATEPAPEPAQALALASASVYAPESAFAELWYQSSFLCAKLIRKIFCLLNLIKHQTKTQVEQTLLYNFHIIHMMNLSMDEKKCKNKWKFGLCFDFWTFWGKHFWAN